MAGRKESEKRMVRRIYARKRGLETEREGDERAEKGMRGDKKRRG